MAYQMRTITLSLRAALWAAVVIGIGHAGQAQAGPCEDLSALQLPNTQITAAQSIPAGSYTPPGSATTYTNLPAFCRVTATVSPVADSSIGIEVWLPTATWNGKYMQSGNHGFGGTFYWGEMTRQIQRGYATGITNDGHTAATGAFDVSWAIGHPQKVIDGAYRAVHELNVNAKLIISAYYGQAAKYVYYDGCSNGGREGMMEAQMFPQDFNGIIIGGVAQWWTHAATEQLFASINLQNAGIQGSTGTTLLNLTQSAATASCDALDGVVDGLITDPRRCHWDPNSLICQPGQNTNCLTPAQAAAIKANIQAMQDPNTGTWLYSGESRGSEFDQLRFSANVGYAAFGVANYELAHQNLNWNPATFNMDTDLPVLDNALGIYNALNPNLQPFEQAGGRLIEWHEWDDYAFTPEGIIKYYGQVIDQTGQGDLNAVQSFYRLFMLPGVGHCTGTTDIGPDNIGAENQTAVSPDPQHDIVSALEAWVEQGVAPANLIATKFVNNDPTQAIQMQRPVCPYPQQAIYSGSGNTNVASNFYCGRLYGYTLSAHDFDGDGKSDVLWRDTSSNVGMWLMGNNGTTISQAQVLGNVTAIWAAIGQRDFNSDDNADVLWRDSSGNVGFWLMNGTHIMSTTVLGNVPTNWSVVGTSDFNRDGNADILWRDANTGAVAIWLMSGSQVLQNGSFVNVGPQLVQSVNLGTVPNNWTVAGTDGLGTIIWRDSNSGTVGIWLTDGLHITQTVTLGAVPSNWTIAGVGDFDGNGSADILWRDTSGNVGMWLMNGTQIMQTTVLGNVPLIWTIAATGDYAGSGTSGILWTDNTGNVGVWFMNGTTVSSTKVYGNVGTTWSVQSLNAD